MQKSDLFNKIYGCLVGGCIGDAMGEPVEGLTYKEIESKFGTVNNFEGEGTDDSLLKHLMCKAIFENDGYITADEWANVWRSEVIKKDVYKWLYIPVRNAWHKLRSENTVPRNCGKGNMASSSSAMCNSPMGIINACFPKQATLEAFQVASLIHHNFCRDAAAAMAAAIAQAFLPEATINSVLEKAIEFLPPESSREFIVHYEEVMDILETTKDYNEFRATIHNDYIRKEWVISDSRDTVPSALALFKLSEGNPKKAIVYGANFGRDTDTIASMVGSLAGAYSGIEKFPDNWIKTLNSESDINQEQYAKKLTNIVLSKRSKLINKLEKLNSLVE